MFQAKTWTKAHVLLVGTVLATRKRTVTSALRIMGLSDDTSLARYHHVLNRAVWSPLKVGRVLPRLLIQHLDHGDDPLVFGIDETLERRRGRRIKAKGIYRDAVRSGASHFVKASGLRWISLMWLTPIPWARRTWALPVLTALAPSERYCQQMGRTHKKITDWARQIIIRLRRWLPNRAVWSPTAVTLPSTRSPSVSPCPAPSPSSPDCAWMPRSMNPLHLDCQDRSGVRASKANGCPSSRNPPTNRQPSGQA